MIAWLPGVTWERLPETKLSALRSFYIFCLFLVSTLAVYFVYSFLDLIVIDSGVGQKFAFYGQSLVSLLYLVVSLLLAGLQLSGKEIPARLFPDRFLLRIAGEDGNGGESPENARVETSPSDSDSDVQPTQVEG